MNHKNFHPILIAILTLVVSHCLGAQPSIDHFASDGFVVTNSEQIIFVFERDPGQPPPNDSKINIKLPDSNATFVINKGGELCDTVCSGSDASPPVGDQGDINIIKVGDEGEDPLEFSVSITVPAPGDWEVPGSAGEVTQNAIILSIHALPDVVVIAPAQVPSGAVGVTMDASASHPVFEPADSPSAPDLTFAWSQVSGPDVTLSGAMDEIAGFDAPTVEADTDLVFEVEVGDGTFTVTEEVTVTVSPRALPVDAVLLVDTSGSMAWHRSGRAEDLAGGCCSRLSSAKLAARYFVDRLGTLASDSRVAVVIFPGELGPESVFARRFAPATGLASVAEFPDIISEIGDESRSCGNCEDIPDPAGTPTGIPVHQPGGTPTQCGLEEARDLLTAASSPGDRRRVVVLLSDGAWNLCPDPAAEAFLEDLRSDEIRVYTLGMGTGTDDVNHASLQDISVGTGVGSVGNPIGFTAYEFGDANSQPNMVPFFEKIMNDMVTLDFAADPQATVRPGQPNSHPITVSGHDRLMSVSVSWEASQEDLLDFFVETPDCEPLRPQVSGRGYKSLTIDASRLRAPEPGDSCAWRLEVRQIDSGTPELSYNWSAVTRSTLNLRARLDKDKIHTGDDVLVEARLVEDNRRLPGARVEVRIVRPRDGIGAWHFLNRVDEAILAGLPEEVSGEPMSLLDRKNFFLLNERQVALPGVVTRPAVTLADDGRGADRSPGDGIYTARLDDFPVTGIYELRIVATGTAANGDEFRRELSVQKFVDLVPDPQVSETEAAIESIDQAGGSIRVSVTPRDQAGNYLGPGYAGDIAINCSACSDPEPEVRDLLFGAYQRRFRLDDLSDDPRVVISTRGVTLFDGPLSDLRRPVDRWAVSLRLGVTEPFDGDFSFGVDLGYHLSRAWSLELLVGQHTLPVGLVDVDLFQTSLNARYSFPVGLFRFFVQGGIGTYEPDPGDSGLGWNAGSGLSVPLRPRIFFEAAYNRHEMTEGSELEFETLQLGFRFAF